MTGKLKFILPLLALVAALASCKDKESYADLLNDENQAVNSFLADYPVIGSVPADTVFRTLVDVMAENPDLTRKQAIELTPFYRMDDDGYVYMQVLNPGTPGNMVKTDQLIYFRFSRWNLGTFYKHGLWEETGNSSDLGTTTTSFRFESTLASTTQWGEGIQVPLHFLPLDCEVNMVIKSYLGPGEELAAVYPYLYSVRYFPSRI